MSIDLAKNFELPKKSNFATAGALVLVAALLAGCSSVPNWANPVEWYEGAADAIFGDKESESISSGDARRPTYTSGENKDFPKLASVPERPKAPTIGERKRLAERLTSDRENAKYSQETIRRQSEAAVSTPPPPPAEAATASRQPLPAPFTAVRPVAPLGAGTDRLHAAIIDATVSGTTGIRGIALGSDTKFPDAGVCAASPNGTSNHSLGGGGPVACHASQPQQAFRRPARESDLRRTACGYRGVSRDRDSRRRCAGICSATSRSDRWNGFGAAAACGRPRWRGPFQGGFGQPVEPGTSGITQDSAGLPSARWRDPG